MEISNERKLFKVEDEKKGFKLIAEATITQDGKVESLIGNAGLANEQQPALSINYNAQNFVVAPYDSTNRLMTLAVSSLVIDIIKDIETQLVKTSTTK